MKNAIVNAGKQSKAVVAEINKAKEELGYGDAKVGELDGAALQAIYETLKRAGHI